MSETKKELVELLQEKQRRKAENKLQTYFPETGEFSRDKYTKQLEFFRAGKNYNERLFIAGNRCGKTVAGAYETTLHLTGLYPDWWEGYRFDGPISVWVAGDTNLTVRDILQKELLGPAINIGTGMVPKSLIHGKPVMKAGVPQAVDTAYIKHVSGGLSEIGFKAYEQGRVAYQGTAKHIIWLDEEPPRDVYTECLTRTMTIEGAMLYITFTPLRGLSDVVLSFLPDGQFPRDGIVPQDYMYQNEGDE